MLMVSASIGDDLSQAKSALAARLCAKKHSALINLRFRTSSLYIPIHSFTGNYYLQPSSNNRHPTTRHPSILMQSQISRWFAITGAMRRYEPVVDVIAHS